MIVAVMLGAGCQSGGHQANDDRCSFADAVPTLVEELAFVACDKIGETSSSVTYRAKDIGVAFEIFRSPGAGEKVRPRQDAVMLTTPQGQGVIFEGGEAAKVRFAHGSTAFTILILDEGPTEASSQATAIALRISDALVGA